MKHHNFCPETIPRCSGQCHCGCDYGKPNKPSPPDNSGEISKFCASREELLVLSPPGESSEKIPFDNLCFEGDSIFAQKKAPEFVILKNGCYCINFKADRIENESTPTGFKPLNMEINIISSISGLISSHQTPVNGQEVHFCRQLFLKAGEILYLELKHDVNTETILVNYHLSVKHVQDCNLDHCKNSEELQDSQSPCDC